MPVRIALLRGLVALGTCVVLITEIASAFGALTRPVLIVCWTPVLAAAAVWIARHVRWDRAALRLSLWEAVAAIAVGTILAVTAYVAILSPPNSSDTMAYHLPRVLMWVQNGSVAFFPTSYLNLIMLQPVAEYAMLHLYLLSGGDSLTNLVQFVGFAGSVTAASAVAREMGLARRGQWIAAVLVATLPNGILQASGAKNDCLLALWLVCALLFALRRDLLILGLSCGLALGTKGTAYLFLPGVLIAAALWRAGPRALVWIAAGVLTINGPHFVRNYDLSGSVLGFDSAHADGAFRWRNEHLGWRPVVSNFLRNLSEQLGARSESWNRAVYTTVLNAHSALGLDASDPATTWRWSEFRPPRNSNHEADANNRWHLLLIAVAMFDAVRRRDRPWLLYGAMLTCGILAFCFYLKWQPYFSRLLLPLFVLAAPLPAAMLERLRPVLLHIGVCALLVSNARLAVTENWTRPLHGVRTTPREVNYFNDMVQWNNRASYLAAVERVAASSCRTVGLDNLINHVTYPFQALLLLRAPDTRFVFVGVKNASAKYSRGEEPCAVLCIDCADAPERLREFELWGTPELIGRFALFGAR